jgi:hypothetical protein
MRLAAPFRMLRHGRPRAGHPRLRFRRGGKTWMPATSAGMTRAMIVAYFLMLAGPAAAQQPSSRCLVNDPSTTPLNLRSSPMGTIIGTLANRQTVQILEQTVDDRGRSWARVTVVSGAGTGREGWVFREFIACF